MLPEDLRHLHMLRRNEDSAIAWLTDIAAGIGICVAIYLLTVIALSL